MLIPSVLGGLQSNSGRITPPPANQKWYHSSSGAMEWCRRTSSPFLILYRSDIKASLTSELSSAKTDVYAWMHADKWRVINIFKQSSDLILLDLSCLYTPGPMFLFGCGQTQRCDWTVGICAVDLPHVGSQTWKSFFLQFNCLILVSPGCSSQRFLLPKRAQCRIKSFADHPRAADFALDQTTVKNILKHDLAQHFIS